MNLAPLLYDVFARQRGLPRPRNEPGYLPPGEHTSYPASQYFRLPPEDALEQVAEGLRVLLEPRSLTESLPRGRAGVAVLDQREVDFFLRDLPDGDIGKATRWWEFLPLDDETFALFPNDADQTVGFEVLLPVRVRPATYQFRRLSTGLAVDTEGRFQQGPTAVDVELCQINGDRSDEELPYEGRCEGEECAAGCTDHAVVHASDGTYRLVGCDCPEDEG
jgi:hypothetical protein